ncbi:HPF/RaiA family ribosome-associated protein [Chelativorans sp. AA-79]|uniref:HPF/RaiA family ribosome-associated protein n=1 Tax=Chelativorans sp. AA-79 TaxID=3028735 RepID=UPI0023F8C201|nr:HPF/RaiA family ribosome-associated protein [Chelativorans sp. AA-79]WEX08177.1 HPF/RaiA family ribosome-associated protein [Chelativorans sp. AA-79]
MQKPLKITFRNMEPSEAVEAHVLRRMKELEKRFDRIVDCEVVIEAAARKRISGRAFKVHVNLHVPGQDIDLARLIGRGAAADNISLAVHEAFSAAARRLLDRKQQMAGH